MLSAARGLAPSSSVGHSRVRRASRQNVSVELRLDADCADFGARGFQHSRGNWRDGGIVEQTCAAAGVVPLQNLQLFSFGRICDANLHQKAIELRLGQRIRALEVDRVLRRKHGEPGGQRSACSVARHLALFHALEQRGLGARRHAVDFVHQQQVSETRDPRGK